MYSFQTKLRVRYSETDQMNFVYYGVYAQYYEIGRVELLRSLGLSYKKLESIDFLMPVVEMNVKYIKPAFYDDELLIKTTIKIMPKFKIVFNYEIFNQEKKLINVAEVVLFFYSKINKKPCLVPQQLVDKLKQYF